MAYTPLTPKQLQEAIDAFHIHGSKPKAAQALGMLGGRATARIDRARAAGYKPSAKAIAARAELVQQLAKAQSPVSRPAEGFEVRGISTALDANGKTEKQWINERLEGRVTDNVPDGHLVKGLSTLVDETGRTRAQWIKTTVDAEKREQMILGAMQAAAKAAKPFKRTPRPKAVVADLLNLYVITDYHMGMLAWARETGAPWDLAIAERVLKTVLGDMLDAAPAAEVGILENLGDFLHFDSLKALTPEHGHLLDADSRYQKVVEVTADVLIWCVQRMLEKHARVHVDMREGNHDPAGSIWLRVLFSRLFANEPRVTVEKSPRPYVIYPWGQTLLGFHHGHLQKNQNLPQLFAALFRKEWGEATHTYIHTGHKHHIDEKEHPGANVLQHPTLAAPDAYAARGGWLSKRQALSITYHKTAGEIGRRMHLPPE